MADQDSLQLFDRTRERDPLAERQLHDRYVERLIGLVRAQLSPSFNRRFDPEDVVQSVYRSFFGRLQVGGYTLSRNGDLWSLLAGIARNKVRERVRLNLADCRTVNAEDSGLAVGSSCGVSRQALIEEPTPEEAAMLSEILQRALAALSALKRQIIEKLLQGDSAEEVAAEVNCTLRTVQRTAKQFRDDLDRQMAPE
jgi:RNA polymerase sigma-70 factor (ECF subfamily)